MIARNRFDTSLRNHANCQAPGSSDNAVRLRSPRIQPTTSPWRRDRIAVGHRDRCEPAPPEAARVPSGNDFLGVPATPAFVAWVDSETSFHLFQALHPQKKWRANSALRHAARASHHGRGHDHSVFETHPCQTITIASVSSSQYFSSACTVFSRSTAPISVNCILA